MNTFFSRLLVLLLLLSAQFASAGPNVSYRLAFSSASTDAVVGILEKGIAQCQVLEAAYRFDCYRQSYRSAAAKLNGKPDYRAAQQALREVEKTLKDVVGQYRDNSKPSIRVAGKTYKAVTPVGIQPGAAAFSRARAQAVTELLRADGRAKVHYQRIAAVIGSDKLIIRS